MIRPLHVAFAAAVVLAPEAADAARPLTLDSALQVAESNAPKARQAEANIKVAQARVSQAQQFANPEVRLGVDVPDNQEDFPSLEAGLRFKLDHPADRIARKSRRSAQLAQVSIQARSDRRDVERAVRGLFVEHAYLRRSHGLVTRRVALGEERVALTREALPYGTATPLDVRRAQRSLLLERHELRDIQRGIADVEAELASVLGLPLDEVTGMIRHALPRPAPLPEGPTLVAHALAASEELHLSGRVVAERQRQVKAARWSAAPWTNFVQASRAFPTPDRAGGTEFVVGVTVPLLSLSTRTRQAAEAAEASAKVARTEHAAGLQRSVARWARNARLAREEYAELGLAVASLQQQPPGTTALQRNEESIDQLLFDTARLDAQRDYARAYAELQALGAVTRGAPRG